MPEGKVPVDLLCSAIVGVFETGTVGGDYGKVTLIPGDKGGLTFGKHQTTIHTDNLYRLLQLYFKTIDTTVAPEFDVMVDRNKLFESMPRFRKRMDYLEQSADLYADDELMQALRNVGRNDPFMRKAQDLFFSAVYWDASEKRCAEVGLTLPLSKCVCYDSTVHGGWDIVCRRVQPPVPKDVVPGNNLLPDTAAGMLRSAECSWVQAYLTARMQWLSGHSNTVLHRTVYRVHALMALAGQCPRTFKPGANWSLQPPIVLCMKSPWRDETVTITAAQLEPYAV